MHGNKIDNHPGDAIEKADENEGLEKTELLETKEAPKVKNDPMSVLVRIAKAAAIESIKDEIALYRTMMQDTKDIDEAIKIVKEISDLKLRATGIVLAGMHRSLTERAFIRQDKPVVENDRRNFGKIPKE